jgi:hypothetical protein
MTKQVMKPRRKAKLPQAPAMEPRHKRTLIVVADGARARFFEPRHDTQTLVPAAQADMVAPQSRLQNQESFPTGPAAASARPTPARIVTPSSRITIRTSSKSTTSRPSWRGPSTGSAGSTIGWSWWRRPAAWANWTLF